MQHILTADDFARRFAQRAGNLMWFLGAGASASAGIPTAGQMIWDFKQKLFVSQRKVSPQSVADLSNSTVRRQLQAHVDSSGNFPRPDHPDEYAALFEAVYPAEADRRLYIDSKLTGGKPSFGHIALATLMRAQMTKLIWTTNFDTLIADAAAKVYDSTGPLSVVDLDAPSLAEDLVADSRWPIEVKLHGDFRSRRLKNTDDELRKQDSRLRNLLVASCRRFGLIVAGYSGRDNSVMNTLEEVIKENGAFPSGLFWLHRGEYPPLPRVSELISRAVAAGVEAALVTIENFDECLRDLLRMMDGIDRAALDTFASTRQRWSAAPRPSGHKSWPVIRLNAVPIVQLPTVCRRVECEIGGYAEAREAVRTAGVNVLVSRVNAGVLCFGADADVRAAFDRFGIRQFDLHPIEEKRLRYESGEQGLLRNAMTTALARRNSLDIFRRRGIDLLAPIDSSGSVFGALRKLVGGLSGSVNGNPDLKWREGVGVRLEWANDQLWLLMDPCTVFDAFDDGKKAIVADFSRERAVKRYNRQLNDLLDFWATYLVSDAGEFRALGIADGVDAVFRLGGVTAYSKRSTP